MAHGVHWLRRTQGRHTPKSKSANERDSHNRRAVSRAQREQKDAQAIATMKSKTQVAQTVLGTDVATHMDWASGAPEEIFHWFYQKISQ